MLTVQAGCAARDDRATSWGAGFNAAGGGVWAVQFDTVGVMVRSRLQCDPDRPDVVLLASWHHSGGSGRHLDERHALGLGSADGVLPVRTELPGWPGAVRSSTTHHHDHARASGRPTCSTDACSAVNGQESRASVRLTARLICAHPCRCDERAVLWHRASRRKPDH